MIKKTTYHFVLVLTLNLMLGGIFLMSSCKKYTEPSPVPPPVGPTVTIQQLRAMYMGMNISFNTNTILNAVVTCDESSGNLYKQVYIRDNSGAYSATHNYGAISVKFLQSTQGFLITGDSIAINLNGCTLDKSGGGSLQIDSVVATKQGQITHLGLAKVVPQPIVASIAQIDTFVNQAGGGFIYDGQLVQLNNVEFIPSNVGTTYAVPQAPPAPPQSINKYINDFAGNTLVAYNSGYANFAGQTIPAASGTLTGVANLYTTMQFLIRSYADVQLSNPYQSIMYDVIGPAAAPTIFPPFMYQPLAKNQSAVMAGWTNLAYQGSILWQGAQTGSPNTSNGNPPYWIYHPSSSNYQTSDQVNDMWLISPPIKDYGATPTKYIDFSTAVLYGTPKCLLSVWVSRSFDGVHLIPSQWTNISAFFPGISTTSSSGATPSFKYAHSAISQVYTPVPIPITISGSSPTFYLAFRYRSNVNYSDSTGSTYLLGALTLHN
ncbi:MAG: hypothetical protein JST67_00845 [Bacteroidetes bacterium]|nr:hypothetical protein [Bacteroidota bacterium]